MEDEEELSKPRKAYKLTQSIFYLLVIPLLILALVSGIIMFNTKISGGYPNFLGYTVLQFADNSFYDPTTQNYAMNEYNMFVSLSENEYKIGDLIGYYSAVSDSPPIQGHPSWPSANLSLALSSGEVATLSTEELSEISFGIIGNIGFIYDTSGNSYKCFSLFSSLDDGSDQDTIVLAQDTIGVATYSAPFFIDFLLYCSTFSSFVTLVLIPCIILLALQILSTMFRIGFEREKKSTIKQKIRSEEIKIQEEYTASIPHISHPLDDRADLARTVEAFEKTRRPSTSIFNRIKKPKKFINNQTKAPIPSRPDFIRPSSHIPIMPKQPKPQPNRIIPVKPMRPIPTKPLKSIPVKPVKQAGVIPTKPTKPIPIKPIKPIPTKPIKPIPTRPIPIKPIKPIPTKPIKPIPTRPIPPKKQ